MAERFYGFRFNTANGFDHLARAMAWGAVSDHQRTRNPLAAGATVVVLAKVGDDYIAASGTATGRLLDATPQDIWPAWEATCPTVVHEVVFKTRPVKVPSEVARRAASNTIKEDIAEDLAYYAFAHS